MGDLSAAILVGRLTRDSELKYTSTGQAVCHFSVATNSRIKKGDQWIDDPNYWEVDLWGKPAESLNQYLLKGTLVAVNGDMRQDKWEQDGQTRTKIKIKAHDVRLLGGGQGAGRTPQGQGQGQAGGQTPYDRPAASRYGAPAQGNGYTPEAPVAPQQPYGGRTFPPQGGSPVNDDFSDDVPF